MESSNITPTNTSPNGKCTDKVSVFAAIGTIAGEVVGSHALDISLLFHERCLLNTGGGYTSASMH